jgi:hypothetical protein
MKILVVHDTQGNIRSIGVPSTKSGGHAMLKPQQGYQIAEIEAPDVRDELDYEHLHAIREHFRIEVAGGHPALAPRQR